MKTLIALLGHAPGTVTAAFYALQIQGYGLMDRVITVTTNSGKVDDCERMIASELARWQSESGQRVIYEPQRIAAPDLEDEASTDEFQLQIGDILHKVTEQGDEVYLSLAGGRKSMAALAAIAAQFIGADKIKMFHLYVSDELERQGDIDNLLISGRWRDRCLRPEPQDYVLVEVPFGPESRVNQFVYLQAQRRAREDPNWLLGLPDPIKENLWGYHYEVKVAEYIQRHQGSAPKRFQYDRSWSHHPLRDSRSQILRGSNGQPLRLDVYAERDERDKLQVLAGECKLSLSERADKDRLLGGLFQLQRDRQMIENFVRAMKVKQGESRPIAFEQWLVTNAPQVPRVILEQAAKEGVQVMYARTPPNWKTNVEWQVDQLRLAEALSEEA
ncbi:MAG: hypothetical protein ISS50_02335 [Anaerolineae bacterium]|nr:hypothetical protein [Anaerolineae bacterium]